MNSYSESVSPFTALTKKRLKFQWTLEADTAFQLRKEDFTSIPVLMHFDSQPPIIVDTDNYDYLSARVVSEHDDEGIMHPVAFYSKKHSPAQSNYESYAKKLLAIIRCLEEWCPHLESTGHNI